MAVSLLGELADLALNNMQITANGRASYPRPNHAGAAKAIGVACRIMGLDLGDPRIVHQLELDARELRAKVLRLMADEPKFSDKIRRIG